MAAFLVMLIMIVVGTAVIGTVARFEVYDDEIRWLAVAKEVTFDEGVVYARYLERHRFHRFIGGAIGVIVALVTGARVYSAISIGFSNSPLADTLFCGVAGVVVGALSAETYRLSEPRHRPAGGVSTASLAARNDPALPRVVLTARCLAVLQVLLGGVLTLAIDNGAPILVSGLGAVVVGVAELTRRAIVSRRRLVMSDVARRVDGRLRSFATGSVAWLELSAASLGFGWTIASASAEASGATTILIAVVTLAALVTAVVSLRRAAPRPPRWWNESLL